MEPQLREFLGCFILMLGGLFLHQIDNLFFRKIGMSMIWMAGGLIIFFLTNSIPLAAILLTAWIFSPIWEMVFILRKLRVPRHRELANARAPRDEFEELPEITHELIDVGFQVLDECRLQAVQHEQYYRIFGREDGVTQATIGYFAQGAIGFHFVAFASDGKDGRRWVTWDYPLTYWLVMPPYIAVFRALHCHDVAELYQAHLDFLEINEVKPADLVVGERTAEAVRSRLEQTLNQQVEYNISRGYLSPTRERDAENFCYSWRGTFYLAGQLLRDLLF